MAARLIDRFTRQHLLHLRIDQTYIRFMFYTYIHIWQSPTSLWGVTRIIQEWVTCDVSPTWPNSCLKIHSDLDYLLVTSRAKLCKMQAYLAKTPACSAEMQVSWCDLKAYLLCPERHTSDNEDALEQQDSILSDPRMASVWSPTVLPFNRTRTP
jgi:hypothetical protein